MADLVLLVLSGSMALRKLHNLKKFENLQTRYFVCLFCCVIRLAACPTG
jgi:hypothetical protein